MASTIMAVGQKAFAYAQVQSRGQILNFGGWLQSQQDRWVLFAPVMLGVGIALWMLLPWNVERQAALIIALGIALLGLAFEGLPRRLIMGAGLLLALGIAAAEWRSAQSASPRLHHRLTAAWIEGQVRSITPQDGGRRASILLTRDASSIDPAVNVRFSTAMPLAPGIEPGARIAVEATLGPIGGAALPGGYDPARRAWFEGLAATGRAMKPPLLLEPAKGRPLARLRSRLGGHIAEKMPQDTGGIAVALTAGEQGRIGRPLLETMRAAGLAHILTVSGFHIAAAVAGVFFITRRLLGLCRPLVLSISVNTLAALIAGTAGTLYMLISGAEPPAVRAAIAAWVVLCGVILGRDAASLRLVGFAAFTILLFRPEVLLSAGFQLSFAAVTMLVAFAKSRPGRWLFEKDPEEAALRRGGKLFLGLLATGLVAEAALMPIALFHFGKAGAYGVLTNMLAIPLTSLIIMPLLFLWLVASWIGLEGLITPFLDAAIGFLILIAQTGASADGALIRVPAIPFVAILALVAAGLMFCIFTGRSRLIAAPLALFALGWIILAPRPDIFIGADGRQIAMVSNGKLATLRPHRQGIAVRAWEQAAGLPAETLIQDLPNARCTDEGCAIKLNGLNLLATFNAAPKDCSGYDVVTSPNALGPECRPRWLLLDAPNLKQSGAASINSHSGLLHTVAARAGDQPWSPSALPGRRPSLLGGWVWTGVIAE